MFYNLKKALLSMDYFWLL